MISAAPVMSRAVVRTPKATLPTVSPVSGSSRASANTALSPVRQRSSRCGGASSNGSDASDAAGAGAEMVPERASCTAGASRSGTHAAELRFWRDAGLDLAAAKGDWYKEIGQGMGPALNTASAANAYVLSDRATWLAFKNRGDLAILVEGDRRLLNQYGVMLVNPARHPQVKVAEGQAFIDWLVSGEGQKAFAEYKIEGGQLFFPNAGKAGEQ